MRHLVNNGVLEKGDFMKPLALCIVWIVCSPGFAQDQTDNRERWACITGTTCVKTLDVQPDAQEFARTAKVGRYWPATRGPVVATFAANQITSAEGDFQLRGNVEINTNSLILRADEAVYHWKTGEIIPRGNVVVKSIESYRGLNQFGIR
jgi:hypothetical protein